VINPLSVINSTGNMTLSTGSYITFGSVDTVSGYGIRDNGGQLQFKNSTGNWQSI